MRPSQLSRGALAAALLLAVAHPTSARPAESAAAPLSAPAKAAAAVATSAPVAPSTAGAPLTKEVLSNGLTLYLQEDHTKPLVGLCLFVNGGSRTEPPELSGLSHYYEHLIYRGGSARQAELEFLKEMMRIGEETGGYTTDDYTCYGFTAPKSNLDEALWRSLDAWFGLKLTQAKVNRERQVVMEEYNQGEDLPNYKVYYQIERLMFRDHPYKRDTIGLKGVIQNSTLATFRTFYADRYVPNQMILAVVGDFDSKAMRSKLARAFAPYRRGKADFELGLVEPPQSQFRMGIERMKTASTWTYLGFHAPPYRGPDSPALTVIAALLGRGTASRLHQALKEKKSLATEVDANFQIRKDPGMFLISAEIPPQNEAKVLAVIRDELLRLSREPVPAAELARVQSAIVNDYVFAAQTSFARAQRLCLFGLMSDVSMAALWPQLIQSVTSEDIQRVAAATFAPSGASYSIVRPADAGGGPTEPEILALVEPWTRGWPSTTGTRIAGAAEPRKETLPNGVTLILNEDHSAPVVAVSTLARGGQWIEPEGLSGVSHMTAILLRRGAGSMTARQISERADLLGMRLTSGGSNDFVSVSWQAPSRTFTKAWEIYAAIVTRPKFLGDEIAKVREDMMRDVRSLGDRPFEFTNLRFAEAIYKTSPYRRALTGDETSLKGITASDLRKAYARMFTGANLVVSISGDFDSNLVLGLARQSLAGLPKGAPISVGGVREESAKEKNPIFVVKDQEQVTYNTGWLGCSILDQDYIPLRAGVSLIGNRLFFKYVYEKGMAYRSWFYMSDRLGQASVQNEMGVSPQNFPSASSGVLEDVTAIVKGPIRDVDMKQTVERMLSTYTIGAQENQDIAFRLGFYELAGLGYGFAKTYPERLHALRAPEVSAALRKYLNPNAYTRVAVGKEPSKVPSSSMAPSH